MKNSTVHKKIKLTLISVLGIFIGAYAQPEKLAQALKFYQGGKLDSARICVDEAVINLETGKDSYAWYLRGFIYKDIYTKREKQNKKSPARLEALKSFKKSVDLDIAKENLKENTSNIKYIAITLRNDVAASLDTSNYNAPANIINQNIQTSIENWEKYKEAILIIAPSSNFEQEETEFNLVMGSFFQNVYEKDKKNKTACIDSAKKYFAKVLATDPSNSRANYGMAIAFYNQGADIVNNADYDIDLIALDQVQDNAKNMFLKSQPFMEKAYQLDPNRDEVIKGLCGIYYALNEEEKSLQLKCNK